MVQKIGFPNRRAISKHFEILPLLFKSFSVKIWTLADTRWEKEAHTRTPNERLR